MDTQTLLALAAVATAAVFLGRRFYLSVIKPGASGCAKCNNTPNASNRPKRQQIIPVEQLQRPSDQEQPPLA